MDKDNVGAKAIIDYGIAVYFKNPESYTGEDVVELQGHGGPAVLSLLLKSVLSVGARQSRPGEFTERAFLNDKLDLAQAEAVSDLIESDSEAAAKAAVRSLGGALSDAVSDLLEQLIALRIYIEAALDFAEEEIDFLSSDELKHRTQTLMDAFDQSIAASQQGRLLKEGLSLVIAGKPNAGKSSLLNRLSGKDSAIVTDIPGTTRDVLREHIELDGLPLHIIDTAGLRDSDDPVEREGVRRARHEINQADRVLLVVDANDPEPPELPADIPADVPVDIIYNKIDQTGDAVSIDYTATGTATIKLSIKQDTGIDLLIGHLTDSVGFQSDTEGVFLARQRHVDALIEARAATKQAIAQVSNGDMPELAAEDLRRAQRALNEITGEFSNDDLLGRIFAGFCIGK